MTVSNANQSTEQLTGDENTRNREHICHDRNTGNAPRHPPAENPHIKFNAEQG